MTGRLRLDQEEFREYLIAEGYPEPDARALVDGVLEDDDDTEYLDITTADGHIVRVELDWSLGFAGLVEFILPGGADDDGCE